MPELPEEIKAVGFDFSWDNRKVWALDLPVKEVERAFLEWHFDINFLESALGMHYNLTPKAVLQNPGRYPEQDVRIKNADMSYAIDYMLWKDRPLILDGLHRLMKAHMLGIDPIRVREVPVTLINRILKDA